MTKALLSIIICAAAILAAPGSGAPQGIPISKLRCKIVPEGIMKCSDAIGRPCDDSPYLEVSKQCDQIWRKFATLAIVYKSLANF